MQSIEVNNIFSLPYDQKAFTDACKRTFHFQYAHNPVYRKWCDLSGFDLSNIKTPTNIPSLPISFFKSHKVVTTDFDAEVVFESSGTTGANTSRHLVKDLSIYRKSFADAFSLFYGDIRDYCILGLLPSYLERQHSSLVLMVQELIEKSGHVDSGFYLFEHEKLSQTIQKLEKQQQKTILIGVTYALLDFAAAFPQKLTHTIIMETGGMKGRRKEMTREEVHQELKQNLGLESVHSEYGMTELLSQAFSTGNGRFRCPPWMKVLVRDTEDPLTIMESGRGALQIIDLANYFSCSFIATEDLGHVYEDGSFDVMGRIDNSDIRGCGLMII